MPDLIVMAKAAGIAALIAAVLGWLVGRFSLPGGALAVATAMLAGAWALGLVPRVPPREALDRFLIILIPFAVLAETLAATTGRTQWVGLGLRLVVASLALPVLVHGSSYVTDLSGPETREWTVSEAAIIYIGLAFALILMQRTLSLLAKRAALSTALVMVVATAGAAITIMLSGYATGGQLAIPLAAAMGAFVISGGRHAEGAVAITVTALFSLLIVGKLFAGLTTLSAVVLFAAPLLAYVPEILLPQVQPRIQGALRIMFTAIPVTLILWLAQQQFTADSVTLGESPSSSSLDDYMSFGK